MFSPLQWGGYNRKLISRQSEKDHRIDLGENCEHYDKYDNITFYSATSRKSLNHSLRGPLSKRDSLIPLLLSQYIPSIFLLTRSILGQQTLRAQSSPHGPKAPHPSSLFFLLSFPFILHFTKCYPHLATPIFQTNAHGLYIVLLLLKMGLKATLPRNLPGLMLSKRDIKYRSFSPLFRWMTFMFLRLWALAIRAGIYIDTFI